MFRMTGRLTYDPKATGFLEKWWVMVNCPTDMLYYYNYWLKKKGQKIVRPFWGCHVSVIRGEEPVDRSKHLWGRDDGKQVLFTVGDVGWNSEYFWAEVESKNLEEVRVRYGLTPTPRYGFHLTIGRFE